MPKGKGYGSKKKGSKGPKKSMASVGAGLGAKAATGINPRLTFKGFVSRQLKKGGRRK